MKLVITGSSTGIGRAIAEHRLALGDEVWGWARTPQAELAARHPAFRWSECDVGSWPAVAAAAAAVQTAWPAVDALITCAGLQGEVGPSMTIDPEKWSATVRVNLDGTYYAIRALHQALEQTARPKIVCFSGGGATKARPNFLAYGVAKTGVVRLVETLAEEWRGRSIEVNAVAPGAINTRLTEEVLALGPHVAGEAEYAAAVRQKQAGGSPLSQALGLVDWLLSPASNGISGRLLSAPWDPWATLGAHQKALAASDVYLLRRIVPAERGLSFE